jgi:hypothetical protein
MARVLAQRLARQGAQAIKHVRNASGRARASQPQYYADGCAAAQEVSECQPQITDAWSSATATPQARSTGGSGSHTIHHHHHTWQVLVVNGQVTMPCRRLQQAARPGGVPDGVNMWGGYFAFLFGCYTTNELMLWLSSCGVL